MHSELLNQTLKDLDSWRRQRSSTKEKMPVNILKSIAILKENYPNQFLKKHLGIASKHLYPDKVMNKIQIAQLPPIDTTATNENKIMKSSKLAAEILLPNNITLRIYQ